ncbi:MAG: hypothetical protein FD127_4247, partial [Acidimicrobiaceae bacterium]
DVAVRPAPFDRAFVADFVHSDTADYGVDHYYREVSEGRTRVTGDVDDVHGWYTLAGATADYCSRVMDNGHGEILGYACDLASMHADAIAAWGRDPRTAGTDVFVMVYDGYGTVGVESGLSGTDLAAVTVPATNDVVNARNTRVVVHEIGHFLGLRHAAGWRCDASTVVHDGYVVSEHDVSPSPEELTGALDPYGCSLLTYGDEYDPMGGGGTFHHGMFHKWRLGWASADHVVTAGRSGEYVLDAMETASTGITLLHVPIDHGYTRGQYYVVEYRTRTGLDGDDTDPTHPAIDGVLVRRVRVNVSGPGTAIPDRDVSGASNHVYVPGVDFVDPYRGIRLTVLSTDGAQARVRLDYETRFPREDP